MILYTIHMRYRMFSRAVPSVPNRQRSEVDSSPYPTPLMEA